MNRARICGTCEFKTARLDVFEWHSPMALASISQLSAEGRAEGLAGIVVRILTDGVTQTLPESWRGPYSIERARKWISDRDEEGTTLLVAQRSIEGEPVDDTAGLVILFENETAQGLEVRLGYLLAEPFWGRGLGSELIAGLVRWCREQGEIRKIAGGVARDNPSSKRVLEKVGFRSQQGPHEGGEGEEMFSLVF